MLTRMFSLAVAILGLSVFAATPAMADDKKEGDKDTHDGWVVKAGSGRLTMADKDKKEHSHKVAADTEITLDGKKAKLEDLKEKTHIVVTMKGDKVTKIEGHTKDAKDKPETDKDPK